MWRTCTGDYTVPVSLGPWDGADLVATARSHTGIGADQELPPSLRFRRNVAKLLKRRHSAEDARRDSLAVFILSPHPPDRVTHTRIPMLDNGRTEVVGRIWFVNEVVRTGHYIEGISDDDAVLFDTICTQIGLGNSPTIVFDPRLTHPEIRFYPDGLSNEDTCIVHAISDTEVSPDTINRVVERIYESSFITPTPKCPAPHRSGRIPADAGLPATPRRLFRRTSRPDFTPISSIAMSAMSNRLRPAGSTWR